MAEKEEEVKQTKQSSLCRSELEIIDFVPTDKNKANINIEQEPTDVKEALETCMTIFFELFGGGK